MNRTHATRGRSRVLCAVVTYNEDFVKTRACQTLAELPPTHKSRIVVCAVANEGPRSDSPTGTIERVDGELSGFRLIQLRPACNGGLALGYNLAVRKLEDFNCEYVLFLNADACVSGALFDQFDRAIPTTDMPILACAPRLRSRSRIVSPFRRPGFAHQFFIISFMFCHRLLFPAPFRFPARYWLDGIDYWFSHHLWRAGVMIKELSIELPHHLSVTDAFPDIAAWRYRNVLATELRFNRENDVSILASYTQLARSAVRSLLNGRADLLPEVWSACRTAREPLD